MSNIENAPNLDEAKAGVEEAWKRYMEAKHEEEQSRRESTARLNTLNEAQRRFDAAVEALHQRAPRDSDWWRRKHERTGL